MNTPVSSPFKTATLITVNNPFEVQDQSREVIILQDDATVRHFLPAQMDATAVSINGEIIEQADWATHRVVEGDYVVLCPIPGGGEGGGKNFLRIAALIAVTVASGGLGGALAGTAFGTSIGLSTSVATGALTIAGSMVVNSLIPIEQSIPTGKSLEDNSPTYGIDGPKNTQQEGLPVPVVYGYYRHAGNIVGIRTENVDDGEAQNIYMLITLSEGPIGGVDESTIKINDQPIKNFEGPDIKPEIKTVIGTKSQNPISFFNDSFLPYSIGSTIKQAFSTYTTQGIIDKFRLDVVAPRGFRVINSKGESEELERNLLIEYRRIDNGVGPWERMQDEAYTGRTETRYNYHTSSSGNSIGTITYNSLRYGYVESRIIYANRTPNSVSSGKDFYDDGSTGGKDSFLNDNTRGGDFRGTSGRVTVGYLSEEPVSETQPRIYGKRTSAYRVSFTSPQLARGKYEIRIKRYIEESAKAEIVDSLVWSDLNEIQTEDVAYRHTAMMAIKIRVTDQLNSVPKVTCEMWGRKVWQPEGSYLPDSCEAAGAASGCVGLIRDNRLERVSTNPAWIALDMLTHQRYGPGKPDHRIDMEAFYKWAQYCEQTSLEFNGIFDTENNFWDQLMHVFRCGHAKPVPQGLKFSVAIERAEFPTMMFNVSNMKRGTLSINWLPIADRANEVEATYYDPDNNYKPSIIKVIDSETQNERNPRVQRLNLIGTTSYRQAAKEINLLLNMNKFIQQTASFEAPIEAISCRVGDLVYIQHDIPQWGYGGRIEGNSTTTKVYLDRPVEMQLGERYSLMVNYDHLEVASGLISARVNNYNLYIDSTYLEDGYHQLFINGREYTVRSMFSDAARNQVGVTTVEPLMDASPNDFYELYRLDALEEREVVVAAGETNVVTLQAPLPKAPARYVKWLFGKLESSKKLFRILSIAGESVHERTISAIEYYDELYTRRTDIPEPPNYSDLIIGEQVSNLSATQMRRTIGLVTQPVVRLEWSRTESYGGADIFVRRDNGQWRSAGSVRDGINEFEYADLTAGERLTFRVVAVDSAGARASVTTAPTISIRVTAGGDLLEPPNKITCQYTDAGIKLTWDNVNADNYFSTQVFHATVNDVGQSSLVFKGSDEVYIDEDPTISVNNYYWLRTVNSDNVAGLFSGSVTPDPLAPVTNLRERTPFIGDTAQITWDKRLGATRYIVEVYTKGVLRRSESVTANTFDYNIEDAKADGDVDRDITFIVYAEAADGSRSQARTLAVRNPPPGLPLSLSVLAGFKIVTINFLPPDDADYRDTVIWIGEFSGFNPDDSTLVGAVGSGPVTLNHADANKNYYIRLSTRDSWGPGTISSEYNAKTLQISDLDGISPWAYVTQKDRDFIDQYLEDDSITSTKIKALTASRIVTGTLAATENIGVEGQVVAKNGTIRVTLGPKLIGNDVALFSAMNGSSPIFQVNEDGGANFTGKVTITGGSGYFSLDDRPTTLDEINSTEHGSLKQDITQAFQDISTAQDTADGRIQSFYQTTEPTNPGQKTIGNLWFDTDDGNRQYRYDGLNWVDAQDSKIAQALNDASDAQATADGRVTTFFQTTTPTANAIGDLWYNSNDRKLKRWNGTVWEDTATQGADWNSTLSSIPNRITDNATTGLNLTNTYMGFYDGTAFRSYIASNGNFHFGGVGNNFLDWNGSKLVIETDNFSVDGAGNATFSGDVSASDITGSTITASTITGSTLQTATTGERVVISSATNSLQAYDDDGQLLVSSGTAITAPGQNGRAAIIGRSVSPGYTAGVYGEGTDGSGVIGKSNGSYAGVFGNNVETGIDPGVGVLAKSLGDYGCWGLSEEDAGVNGASFGGTGVGVRGQGTIYDFYAAGSGTNYGPFTGAHDGLILQDLKVEAGDILISTGIFERVNISNTIPYLDISTTVFSKAAYGILVGSRPLSWPVYRSEVDGMPPPNSRSRMPAALQDLPVAELDAIRDKYDVCAENALGEGQINVCSESGDFEVGDFICTSNTAGKGMRYDGQDMRYVVAKCMEPVVWTDEPANIKMVACIYMCG
jgi:predicted phage tail protein